MLAGDVLGSAGPSVVNRKYLAMGGEWLVSPNHANSWLRTIEFAWWSRYDGVIVSSISKFHVIILLVARLTGRPSWYLAHGIVGRESITKRRAARLTEWLHIHLAEQVLCVSQVLADDMARTFRADASKYEVAANGGELPRRRPEAFGPGRPLAVLTVGTAPIKNVERLLAALALAKFDYQLTIVGSMPTVNASNVRVTGELVESDVRNLMRTTDIYVQVSHAETFGLAIMEAASEGCELVIPANAGCVPYLSTITSENLIDNVNDTSEITSKIDLAARRVATGRKRAYPTSRTWQDAEAQLHELVVARLRVPHSRRRSERS